MQPSKKRGLLQLLIAALLILTGGFFLEDSSFFTPVKESLQGNAVSSSLLNTGVFGKAIRQIIPFEQTKNDGMHFPVTQEESNLKWNSLKDDMDDIAFQRKRKPTEMLYRPITSAKSDNTNPLENVKKIQQKNGWPILYISTPERSLYHPDIGLLENTDNHGRDWERKANVIIFDKGKILFSSDIGLRIHGGQRRTTKPYQSYKLYFRDDYGAPHIPAGLLIEGDGDIKTLVVHMADWPEEQPINNPLAYDFSRRIGAKAPYTSLIEVYLNDKPSGMAFIAEHLSTRQLDQYMTGKKYMFHKYKNGLSDFSRNTYRDRFWIHIGENITKNYPRLKDSVDIDNLTRHLFSLVFSGDEDYCQGVGLLDIEVPSAKLHWLNWDMDHSFYDRTARAKGLNRENWQQNGFRNIYRDQHSCDRTFLFTELMKNVPEYKKYAIDLYTEILNHNLTDDFLKNRIRYYDDMISHFGEFEEYITMLDQFIENRSDFLRAEMAELFHLAGPYTCSVTTNKNVQLLVDGYTYVGSYSGKYFASQSVEVQPADRFTTGSTYWLVGGHRIDTRVLKMTIEKDIEIQLVITH